MVVGGVDVVADGVVVADVAGDGAVADGAAVVAAAVVGGVAFVAAVAFVAVVVELVGSVVGGDGGGGDAAPGPPPLLVLDGCRQPLAGGRGFVRRQCLASLPPWVLASLEPSFLSVLLRG